MITNESDIKKGFECCRKGDCNNCPYDGHAECIDEVLKATLNLINTLEAENEKLNKQVNELTVTLSNFAKATRAEAYKEVWEVLRNKCDAPHWCVWLSEIDDFFEKLVGESDD